MTYSNIIERAASFAADKHKSQYRKEGRLLYISHLVAVALILQKYSFRDEVIAAGLLHDTLEDTDTTEAELLEKFGPEILQYVKEVTEDKSLLKPERKLKYIKNLETASPEALTVACADKIHNARSYSINPQLLTPERKQFLENCLTIFRNRLNSPIVLEFENVLKII
jgi:(p)ppGpp synthase/HD superfamily hydrolase